MSGIETPATEPQSPIGAEEMNITSSLEDLQTDEQRRVLDTVAQVRKCGLDSILSLPQLVVCGDQSAGKSSVLEALTEIPFPRNDNLCTRFATEIHLRRANINSLTIKVLPDGTRSLSEKASIETFEESITDFNELPRVMNLAMTIMGISSSGESDAKPRAFARDTLSIIIEGPSRPQLTLVDIPGLIATHTKGTTAADVELVAEITQHYISQPRTICLAVISATNDYSNQKILDKVRLVDKDGDRTLGIITKPDGLAPGSGSETAYIELARNEDINFKLGWHVLKNRKFEERGFTLMERNASEETFFRTSNFNALPKDTVGIDALRRRLSLLLFEHVKRELPKLRDDLDRTLSSTKEQLDVLGSRRSTVLDCKAYLSQLSLEYWEACTAAVKGHYEGDYFQRDIDADFSLSSASTLRRTRAVVQLLNSKYADGMRTNGHKYQIEKTDDHKSTIVAAGNRLPAHIIPKKLTRKEALAWVDKAMVRNRGMELPGNFNPLIIGELFWEQSSNWRALAVKHIEEVSQVCSRVLRTILQDKCPKDVETRVWAAKIEEALRARNQAAHDELELLLEDLRHYPINYNHYYTDTIAQRRQDRQLIAMKKSINTSNIPSGYDSNTQATHIQQALSKFTQSCHPDMQVFSSEEALDCLFAIYKVMQKTFIANVTTQVIERHIVRGLETIFSPIVVNALSDIEVEAIASEPASTQARRKFLEDRIEKLQAGHEIFKSVM